MSVESTLASRRAFVRFLAASPAVYAAGTVLGQDLSDPYAPQAIAEAGEGLNVFDFHETARKVLKPGHYTYMALGADDGGTLRANREGFKNYKLRVRRLVDVQNVDTSIEVFGQRYRIPVMIAPCGSQRAFHPEAEVAVARAARSRGVEQILSTGTSSAIEDVNAARGSPVWFQLYPYPDWAVTRELVRRAESAGCNVLALTVDNIVSNREVLARHRRSSNPECQACHAPGTGITGISPLFDGIERPPRNRLFMDWDFVDRLRDATSMKLMLKGIVTAEDASLAVEHGVEGIIVSNHGGRAEDSGRSTIECLPEVVAAIDGRIPVIIDSGFRRGTDIFKALALGADAIAVGRPYLWGLGSFGQAGVEAVLDILKRELEIVMQQAGTTSIGAITPKYIA